jgi:putative ABC transport system substrate-binding protein
MNRRAIIAALGSAAAWPVVARGQAIDQKPIVGLLMGFEKSAGGQSYYTAFCEGLEAAGLIDGKTIRLEDRWGGGQLDQLRAFASELIALNSNVLVAGGIRAARALVDATRTVPIVFVAIPDPVAEGFVQSLSHPNANTTGFTLPDTSIIGKMVEILKQFDPALVRIALLMTRSNSATVEYQRVLDSIAPSFGMVSLPAPINDAIEIDRAIDLSCARGA